VLLFLYHSAVLSSHLMMLLEVLSRFYGDEKRMIALHQTHAQLSQQILQNKVSIFDVYTECFK